MGYGKDKIKFNKFQCEGFYPAVREKVDAYFQEAGISTHANHRMYRKTAIILGGFAFSYSLILSNQFGGWAMLVLALVLGFFTALIGVCIAHDAIHGAYSGNPKVNHFMGSLFNVVGANDYLWNITHNIAHHTYPNVPDYDGDINQISVLRMNPNQKLSWFHRY